MHSEQPIPYLLRNHPRARHLRLTISPEGVVTVTAPKWAHPYSIDRFVQQKIEWIRKTVKRMKNVSDFLPRSGTDQEYQKMRHEALAFVKKRIGILNRHYDFPLHRITIRNQRTRWGSCSSRGNLSFSYRVALLPSHLADYIIVHELCHLREHNHSPRFWDLVAQTIPQYREYRKQLRTGIAKNS